MKKQPEFNISKQVQHYWDDTEALSNEWHAKNMQGWHVSEKWSKVFKKHLSILQPLAENGDVMAQYALATIYLGNYIYSTQDEAINNHAHDSEKMSKWLVLAAKQGVLVAIDNLITNGVGDEANKLKELYKTNITTPDTNQREWENNMILLYNLAYEKQS